MDVFIGISYVEEKKQKYKSSFFFHGSLRKSNMKSGSSEGETAQKNKTLF